MTLFSNEGRKRRKKVSSNTRPTPYPQQQNQNISYPLGISSAPPAAQPAHYAPHAPYQTRYSNPSAQYLHPAPAPAPAKSRSNLRETLTNQAGKSVTQLRSKTSQYLDSRGRSCQALNSGAALCDIISSKLDAIITSIDDERFSGTEQDLQFDSGHDTYPSGVGAHSYATDAVASRGAFGVSLSPVNTNSSGAVNTANAAGGRRESNHFAKVWLYTNSRLPPHLPPFKVYLPTWPLICLAATYSESVYSPPPPSAPSPSSKTKTSTTTHIPPSIRSGTKATVLKSLPIDSMHTIIFSIRGTSTFMDWAVNYNSKPSSPHQFLDDPGNACHAGFLHVARQMIPKVSQRLREMLDEQPSRRACSLLITGHSAGGAVATLLYAHMMSKTVKSELTYLTGMFKRVHCVTFGAPPVSLLPLQRPDDRKHRKSLFYSFVNEGDPVPRADKQVVRSLLKLYASPAPSAGGVSSINCPVANATLASLSRLNLSSGGGPNGNTSIVTLQTTSTATSNSASKLSKLSNSASSAATATTAASNATWNMPPTTLSTAGRLIVLRQRNGHVRASEDDIEAVTVDDELLRTVVYGDPVMHMMTLYKRRVEVLATRAVTAGGY